MSLEQQMVGLIGFLLFGGMTGISSYSINAVLFDYCLKF